MASGFVGLGYTPDYVIQTPLEPRTAQVSAARLPGAGTLIDAVNVVALGYVGESVSADRHLALSADGDAVVGKVTKLRAQYLKSDGTRLSLLAAPSLRIYKINDDGTETDALALTVMTQLGATNGWTADWTPAAAGVYIAELRAALNKLQAAWPVTVRARFGDAARRS